MRRAHIPTFFAALSVFVAHPLLAAAVEPPAAQAPTPADGQARSVRDRINSVLGSASSKSDAVLAWLAKKAEGSRETLKDAEAYAKRKVDEALTLPSLKTGVSLLARTAAAPQGAPAEAAPATPEPKWIPLADLPVQLPPRVVLLIHGLDEPGGVWNDLAPRIQAMGLQAASFDYANDQRIAQTADELHAALLDLKSRGVQTVDFVCHSMGGLVARDVLTRPAFYAGNAAGNGKLPRVERFIMLGTPNLGSDLAHLRAFGEAREQLVRWADSPGKDPRLLLGFLRDGAGEAGTDLLPGSTFLVELNARPLPSNVKTTVVVGTVANGVRDELKEAAGWPIVQRALGEARVAKLRQLLDDGSAALGDGVVTVESAKLAGVEDVVMVAANHRTMVKRPDVEKPLREAAGLPPKQASAIDTILDRLSR